MEIDIKKLAAAMMSGDKSKISEALGFNADVSQLEPTPLTDAWQFEVNGSMVVCSENVRELERALIRARNNFIEIQNDCEKMQ